jgi:hypothetical protein
MSVDESQLKKTHDDLVAKLQSLRQQVEDISRVLAQLNSVKQKVVSTSIDVNGKETVQFGNPPDEGTGSVMTDTRRQEIYASVISGAAKVLAV